MSSKVVPVTTLTGPLFFLGGASVFTCFSNLPAYMLTYRIVSVTTSCACLKMYLMHRPLSAATPEAKWWTTETQVALHSNGLMFSRLSGDLKVTRSKSSSMPTPCLLFFIPTNLLTSTACTFPIWAFSQIPKFSAAKCAQCHGSLQSHCSSYITDICQRGQTCFTMTEIDLDCA